MPDGAVVLLSVTIGFLVAMGLLVAIHHLADWIDRRRARRNRLAQRLREVNDEARHRRERPEWPRA